MAKRIVVASGKGGVGKSSISAGLACAFQKLGKNVLAIDCDIGLRSLDIILSACEGMLFNWGDVVTGRCEAKAAITSTKLGPALLCAPNGFEPQYTASAVETMLAAYDDMFDYILLDAPAGLGYGLGLAASCADIGIIVATADDVCVRNAAAAAEALFNLGVPETRLIINRFDAWASVKGFLLNIDDTIDSTRLRLLGIVPSDDEIAFKMSRGKAISRRCEASKAFVRIVGRLEGDKVPLKVAK